MESMIATAGIVGILGTTLMVLGMLYLVWITMAQEESLPDTIGDDTGDETA